MRLGRIARGATAALLGSVIGLGPLPVSTASAAGAPIALKSFSQMLTDFAQHVVIYADFQNGVLIADPAGHTVASIAEPGTLGVALSPDSTTLYVATGTSDSIVAISTTTWQQTALYPTGKGIAPSNVALAGGRIWFGYNQGQNGGGLGSIDPTAADATPTLQSVNAGMRVEASPANPNALVVSYPNPNSTSPNDQGVLEVLNATTATPTLTARKYTPDWNYYLAISPDGQDLATDSDGVLRLADLTPTGLYPAIDPYGAADLAFNTDGTLAYRGYHVGTDGNFYDDVVTIGPNSKILRTYSFRRNALSVSQPGTWIAGIAWDPTTNQILALNSQGPYSLYTLTHPDLTDTTLQRPTTTPAVPHPGQPFTMRIPVTSNLPYPPGTHLHVTRDDLDGHGARALPDVTLDPTAPGQPQTFTIHDTNTTPAGHIYQVTLDQDRTHTGATLNYGINVLNATALTLTTDTHTYAYGGWAKVTAHLGPTYNYRTLMLYAHPTGGSTTGLKFGRVDAHGNLTAWYKLTRNTTFTANFGGDPHYAPATATATALDHAQVTSTLHSTTGNVTIAGRRYALYLRDLPGQAPLVTTAITPTHAGQCVQVTLQRYLSGTWHTVGTPNCAVLGSDSTMSDYIGFNPVANFGLYRILTQYTHDSNDTSSIDTWGTDQYFTVHPN